MDTQENNLETVSYEEFTASSAGQLLKQVRIAAGYSLADVASALEMMVTQVRALENDSFLSKNTLGEDYVINALVRYAQLLELNVDRVVSAYHDAQIDYQAQSTQLAAERRRTPRWLRPTVAAVGTVASVLAIALSLSSMTSSPSVADTAPLAIDEPAYQTVAGVKHAEDLDKLQQEIDALIAKKQHEKAVPKPRLAKLAALPTASPVVPPSEAIEEVSVPQLSKPELLVAEELPKGGAAEQGEVEKIPATSEPAPKTAPQEIEVFQATDFAKLDSSSAAKPAFTSSRPATEKKIKPAQVHNFVAQLYSLAEQH